MISYIIAAIYITILSVIGAAAMYVDKRKAIAHQRRISERNLFAIAILGGGIGCIIGIYSFRHKTRHMKFVIGMPIVTLLSIAAIFAIAYACALI